MPGGEVTALDAWRYLVLVLCAASALMVGICIARAVKRYRQGARRVCVSLPIMVSTLVSLAAACLVAGIQLLWWIHQDLPFAWYRSPIVFLTVLAVCATMLQLINFIYPIGDNHNRNTEGVSNF